MKKIVGLVVLVMLITTLLACEPASAPKIATTPTPEPGISTKAPEDIIPLAVPGFELVEKKTYVSPLFGGPAIKDTVEYYAYTSFRPEAGSRFESKVKRLVVEVELWKDIDYCKKYYTTTTGHPVSVLQVNNKEAILVDNEFSGGDGQYYEVFVYQQDGKLLITSAVTSTLSPFGSDPPTWDKPVVREAAIEGIKAARL